MRNRVFSIFKLISKSRRKKILLMHTCMEDNGELLFIILEKNATNSKNC
jgi:hypothetical protein